MERPDWAPAEIDVDRPSIARVYDCALGGFHNFASDRALVDRVRELNPGVLQMARANRAFLGRAVRYCLRAGIRQFLDLGSGIPTAGNVHEIVRANDPAARVAYVDCDPVAVAHSEAILGEDKQAAVIQADLREPAAILTNPTVRRLIDFDEPVALLMVAVLHFIVDEHDPAGLVDQFAGVLTAGSHLIVSHITADGPTQAEMNKMTEVYRRSVADGTARSREQVLALFGGLELVPPGLTWVAQWAQPVHDDPPLQPEQVFGAYAGVARKV
jgi:hypothetical protein